METVGPKMRKGSEPQSRSAGGGRAWTGAWEGLDRGAGGTGACGDWYQLGGEGVGEAQPLLSLAQNPDKPKQGPTFLLQFTLKY